MTNKNVTHTEAQIMAIESAGSGLVYSGFMKAGEEPYTYLIPVFLREDKSREQRTAIIMRLNKDL